MTRLYNKIWWWHSPITVTHRNIVLFSFFNCKDHCFQKVPCEKFLWDRPGLVKNSSPIGFFQAHSPPLPTLHFPLPTESHHYCQSSRTGPPYGNGTEIDWIGQWSHCKCITLALALLGSYLHTESHYCGESSAWHRDKYVLRVYTPEIPWYELYRCIMWGYRFVHINLLDAATIRWCAVFPQTSGVHLRWTPCHGEKNKSIKSIFRKVCRRHSAELNTDLKSYLRIHSGNRM